MQHLAELKKSYRPNPHRALVSVREEQNIIILQSLLDIFIKLLILK